MEELFFRRVEVFTLGKGKKSRPSIAGIFYKASDPHTDIPYNYDATENAITDATSKKIGTQGLELGLKKIREKHKEEGIPIIVSRKKRRRQREAFIRG